MVKYKEAAFTIVFAIASVLFALTRASEEDKRKTDVAKRLERLEYDTNELRARLKHPQPVPEEPVVARIERTMPWDRMFDCVYDYGLDLRPIDTVAAPNTHNSWVLGGTCETLAHDLRDNEYPDEVWNPMVADTLELQGMCVGYTDDSPIEAAKCQKNMQRWLEVLCWNTLQDPQIRACKRNNLTTSLDHDENERPW